MAALVDWFTLLFFSGWAFVIWVIWIALQTGVPKQPAANVARLAPGFEHSFSLLPFVVAIAGTLAWAWLVKWRVGRHRAAIWKSLVLPASGAALCWLLLMTLWLPVLDFARSYTSVVQRATRVLQPSPCVQAHGLSRGQTAAFQFQGHLNVKALSPEGTCPWLIVNKDNLSTLPEIINPADWNLQDNIRHPTDRDENLLIYQRAR